MRIVAEGYEPDPGPAIFNPDDPRLAMPVHELKALVVDFALEQGWLVLRGYPHDAEPRRFKPWLEFHRRRRIVFAVIKATDG